ncbi:DUF2000 domain-containing protein [Photobacterium nomapromontoriensis]|uniref:DUF2000 domain-containing protein n=1 Tax=Photobacterium nomapromontoriensis TaxID=2910237 RepID=UPI003D0EA906
MIDIFEHKIVIVIKEGLDKGITANRAAVLMSGLSAKYPEIIGCDHNTADGKTINGFTQLPIIILTIPESKSYFELLDHTHQLDCYSSVFLERAQGVRSYSEYSASISDDHYMNLDIDSAIFFGTKKSINKITNKLPPMR